MRSWIRRSRCTSRSAPGCSSRCTSGHYELSTRGRRVVAQKLILVIYRGQHLEGGFRADLIVDDLVLVEVKSTSSIASAHRKQTLTYVRLAELRLGLLIHFGQAFLKDGIVRLVNRL